MPGDKVVVLEDVPMEPQAEAETEAEAEEDEDDETLFALCSVITNLPAIVPAKDHSGRHGRASFLPPCISSSQAID